MIFATWNVRGINRKEVELMQELKQRKVNLAVITETKKKAEGHPGLGRLYRSVEWGGTE